MNGALVEESVLKGAGVQALSVLVQKGVAYED